MTFVFLFSQGTGKLSQQDLETQVEKLGAQLNAYTSREQTVYYAKCHNKDLPQGTFIRFFGFQTKCFAFLVVELLSSIVQNTDFKEEDIERERKTVLRQLQELENNYQEIVFDHLHATAYQGTPLSKSVYGTTDNVQ